MRTERKSLLVGGTITGGTASAVLYTNAAGDVLASSSNFTYVDSSILLKVGTGSGTSAGLYMGYLGSSGFGALWSTSVTPSSSNYAFLSSGGTTAINGSSTSVMRAADGDKLTVYATAGRGAAITAGTATTDVNALNFAQTWNGAVTFSADKGNVTVTSANNGSAVIDRQVNGGSLFRIEYYATDVTAAAGATVTATNLIPAKAQLIGIATRITTQLGNGSGTTGYTVGDGSDADRWGTAAAVTVGTVTDQDSATADPSGYFNAANNVVLTATGGNFDGTGVIRVIASVLTMQAPTS